jgi:hypothetical protein
MMTKKEWHIQIKRSILFISDLHVGSPLSIFPPHFMLNKEIPDQASEYRLNEIQKKLLRHWAFVWEMADRFHVDTVIDCSDSVDGLAKKSYGAGLITTSLNEQIEAYEALVGEHLKGKDYYILSGSDYHESTEVNIYREIASRMTEYSRKSEYLGIVANLKLKDTNRVINVAHGASAAIQYRTTAMDREGMNSLAAYALGELPKADLIVRGHIHRFIHLHLPQQHIIQLPCFKTYEPIKKFMGQYAKSQPSIGAVIVIIDAEDRIKVLPFLVKNPVQLIGEVPFI